MHERSQLGHMGSEGKIAERGVALADYVTVEVGAVIDAGNTVIGEGTIVGVGSKIGRGAVIGKVRTIRTTRGCLDIIEEGRNRERKKKKPESQVLINPRPNSIARSHPRP